MTFLINGCAVVDFRRKLYSFVSDHGADNDRMHPTPPHREAYWRAIAKNGEQTDPISADLGTPNGAALLAKQVRSMVGDRLEVLVLNAGIRKAASRRTWSDVVALSLGQVALDHRCQYSRRWWFETVTRAVRVCHVRHFRSLRLDFRDCVKRGEQ